MKTLTYRKIPSPPPIDGEKPHVFREATKEVAFRNTCGFWANYPSLPPVTARNRGLVSAEERHEADDVLLQLLLHALRLGCCVFGFRAAELAAEERDLALD